MNHKEFLIEIQRRCGLDRPTTALLLQSAVKLMAEQATEQIAVEWENIGWFVATKHPEYVAEDPYSGAQMMYPPRITYRLSQTEPANASGRELNATQFSFHLARYAKAKEEDATFFMQCLSKLILERLDANDSVEIQGLGVLSWVESQQGRRISLQVDDKMRTLVNAPFSCFEPVVVQPAMAPEPTPEPETPEPEPSETTEIEPEITETPEPVVPEPKPSETLETTEIEPEITETPEPVVPEPEPSETTETTEVEPEITETPEPVVPEPEPSETTEIEPEITETSEPSETPEPEPSETPEPVKAPEPTSAAVRHREPEPTWQDKLKALPKSWLYGGIAGVVVLLVLLVWLLIPSGSDTPATKPASPAVQSTVAKQDSTASADTAVQTAAPASTASASTPASQAKNATPVSATRPTDEMLLHENGAPKMDQLSEGERLTLVALRNYGDKAFWAYIYDVNAFQLSNPDNVPVGLPLYLPDPTYFRIDVSDPKSIRRAQNRAMQIIRAAEHK